MLPFGKTLRTLRLKKGISQQELADAFNLQRTTITNYESGKSLPNLDLFVEIVKFFGVTSDLLLGLADTAEVEHLKPKQAPHSGSALNHVWATTPPRTSKERFTQLENRTTCLLQMLEDLSNEVQEMRSGQLQPTPPH